MATDLKVGGWWLWGGWRGIKGFRGEVRSGLNGVGGGRVPWFQRGGKWEERRV